MQLTPLISEAEIAATVKRLAYELDRDYCDRPPVVVGVLKGAFIFLADLIRQMQVPIQRVELLQLSSYGSATESSGAVNVWAERLEQAIAGQPVILVEDIVDTGLSTTTALALLKTYQPASLALCALLDKPERRTVPVAIDYLGHTVPNRFLVGYGLDCNEQYRQLPAVYTLEALSS